VCCRCWQVEAEAEQCESRLRRHLQESVAAEAAAETEVEAVRRQLTDALRANSELEQELDASVVHEDTMEQTVSTLAERLGAAEAAVRHGRR
jgi:predicted  nucleic acid-binding Zn-ribbon protein